MEKVEEITNHPEKDLGLTVLEKNFQGRRHLRILQGKEPEQKLVLKEMPPKPCQIQLGQTLQAEGLGLSFATPTVLFYETRTGQKFTLMEKIEGNLLEEILQTNPQRGLKISKQVARDYQVLVEKFQEKHPLDLDQEKTRLKNWINKVLEEWPQKILEKEIVTPEQISHLREYLLSLVDSDLFCFGHGNIIGDNIIVSEEGIYLLNLDLRPFPGKTWFYDYLRSLDWFLLKTSNNQANTDLVRQELENLNENFNSDEEMIKKVFALRIIGIYGEDFLKRGDLGKGDSKEKEKVFQDLLKELLK